MPEISPKEDLLLWEMLHGTRRQDVLGPARVERRFKDLFDALDHIEKEKFIARMVRLDAVEEKQEESRRLVFELRFKLRFPRRGSKSWDEILRYAASTKTEGGSNKNAG